MAIKDFNTSEDTEHKKPVEESAIASMKPTGKDELTEIKNAHAAGDGSFGRNDESLPDENESMKEKESDGY